MWEREGSHESLDRVTGKALVSSSAGSVSLDGAETLATITYDPESGEVAFESHTPKKLQETS